MKTQRLGWGAVVALALLLGVGSAQAGFLVTWDPDDSTRATGILGLDVGGTPYNVTFTLSTTAAVIYGDWDPLGNNYDFNTELGAMLATDAVNAVLNAENAESVGSEDNLVGSILFRVPFESQMVGEIETVIFWEGARTPPGPWLTSSQFDGDAYFLGERVWARFTVVPAPAGVFVFGPAIFALGGRRRKRTT